MGRIVVINECAGKSILRNVIYLVSLLAAFYMNYRFIGNGVILQILFALLFFVSFGGTLSGKVKRMTPHEAFEYLAEKLSKE